MPDFYMTRGNLLPKITATLKGDSAAVDLTSCTVKFEFEGNGVSKSFAATITDATAGKVEYTWQAADTDVLGLYNAKWEVTFPGGSKLHFPNDKYITFEIVDEVPSITLPSDRTLLAELREPVRAFLGDHNEEVPMFESIAIDKVVRSLVVCGRFPGYAITPDRNGITPRIVDAPVMGLLVFKACEAFVLPDAGHYSYRTRALSESFGDRKLFVMELKNAIADLEGNGPGGMFSCMQTFTGWVRGVTGLNIWEHMTEMKARGPVSTATLGAGGLNIND